MQPIRSLLLALAALPLFAHAQTTHAENPSFKADVTSFHASRASNGMHYLTATIHFQNVGKTPLVLACDPHKIKASDDQGNSYGGAKVRGIGTVNSQGVDAKFVLPKGGGGDMLVEVATRLDERTVRGVAFDLLVPVSEVEVLPSKQARFGVERTVEFTGLKTGFAAAADGKVDAGDFTAEVVRKRVVVPNDRRRKTVEMTVRLTNTSDRPLTLAYEYKSGYGLDDQGNRFVWNIPPTGPDASATGIGMVSEGKADPQLVLAPGESREVRLSMVRNMGGETDGTQYVYYVDLQSLETLPSGQIREVRQYSLTFPGLVR